jgi:hypothetical protein
MSSKSHSLSVIIVEKTGVLKILNIKDYKEEELYKKCGFKKSSGFEKRTTWKFNDKETKTEYFVSLFAKDDGKANSENKYDFPPPVDTVLYFGNCALVAYVNKNNEKKYTSISLQLWNKIYEKLFGGFEDLNNTIKEDEEEEDELDNIPAEKKTKEGYLKDGFVVDNNLLSDEDTEEDDYSSDDDDILDESEDNDSEEEEEEDEDEEGRNNCKKAKNTKNGKNGKNDKNNKKKDEFYDKNFTVVADELCEEDYDY